MNDYKNGEIACGKAFANDLYLSIKRKCKEVVGTGFENKVPDFQKELSNAYAAPYEAHYKRLMELLEM